MGTDKNIKLHIVTDIKMNLVKICEMIFLKKVIIAVLILTLFSLTYILLAGEEQERKVLSEIDGNIMNRKTSNLTTNFHVYLNSKQWSETEHESFHETEHFVDKIMLQNMKEVEEITKIQLKEFSKRDEC